MDAARKFEWEANEIKGASEDIIGPQKTNEISIQMESEIEDADIGLRTDKLKAKNGNWKIQARNIEGNVGINKGLMKLKRPIS